MAYNWNEAGGGKFLKIKVGETVVVKVKSVTKEANSNPKYNLGDKDFYIRIETDKGRLSVNTWGLYFACQGAAIRPDHTYSIEYVTKGGLGKVGKYAIHEIPEEKEKTGEVFKGTKLVNPNQEFADGEIPF